MEKTRPQSKGFFFYEIYLFQLHCSFVCVCCCVCASMYDIACVTQHVCGDREQLSGIFSVLQPCKRLRGRTSCRVVASTLTLLSHLISPQPELSFDSYVLIHHSVNKISVSNNILIMASSKQGFCPIGANHFNLTFLKETRKERDSEEG